MTDVFKPVDVRRVLKVSYRKNAQREGDLGMTFIVVCEVKLKMVYREKSSHCFSLIVVRIFITELRLKNMIEDNNAVL